MLRSDESKIDISGQQSATVCVVKHCAYQPNFEIYWWQNYAVGLVFFSRENRRWSEQMGI